jgi:hypothetical protein
MNDFSDPSSLLRAMIDGSRLYDGYAARRAALRLTSRIADGQLASELTDELFFEIEAVQLQIALDGPASVTESWREHARQVLARIVVAGRQ